MLKIFVAVGLLLGVSNAAFAACSADDASKKAIDIADVLSTKLSSNTEAASKMMQEMTEITGTGSVTDATCTKLDDLMVRAKKI
jgi:hypothetical protein